MKKFNKSKAVALMLALAIVLTSVTPVFAASSSYFSIDPANPSYNTGYSLAMVQNLTIVSNVTGSLTLSWSYVPGAVSYQVYQSVVGSGATFQYVTSTASTTYTQTGLTAGQPYYYVVRAVGSTGLTGPFSAVASGIPSTIYGSGSSTTLAAVQNLAVTQNGTGSLKLTWSYVPGATSYQVYRSLVGSGTTFQYVTSTTSTTYTQTGLINGQTYYYTVRAVGPTGLTGPFSAVASGIPSTLYGGSTSTPNMVQNLTLTWSGVSNITLSWTPVAGTAYYQVYRSLVGTGSTFDLLTTTTSTTFTTPAPANGQTYFYTVRAVTTLGQTGPFSEVVSTSPAATPPAYATPAKVEHLTVRENGSGSLKLTWDYVSGALSYEVYRSYVGSGNTFELVKTTTEISYVPTGLTDGQTYYYVVRALGSSGVYGPFSDVESGTPGMDEVVDLNVIKNGYKSLKLNWDPVEGATGYEVYRSTSGRTGSFLLKKITTSTSYTAPGLTTGKRYYFKVRAVSADGSKGEFSEVDSERVQPSTVKLTRMTVKDDYGPTVVKWKSVPGATGYQIYRKRVDRTTWSLFKDVTAEHLGCTDDLKDRDGKTEALYEWEYKVRAYRVVSGARVYGYFSDSTAYL